MISIIYFYILLILRNSV